MEPRVKPAPSLPIANQLLSHFIDHFSRSAGISIGLVETNWPGSWAFDHVLCEDLGQLIGRGVKDIHNRLTQKHGTAGRGQTTCCMDDALVDVVLSMENRPSVNWILPRRVSIDGFVDSWYTDSTGTQGIAYGTNLRQFIDGFSYGSGASITATIRKAGNLHHLYETIFRALGDVTAQSLGITQTIRLPGESSGIAGELKYYVENHKDG